MLSAWDKLQWYVCLVSRQVPLAFLFLARDYDQLNLFL
jgi:hypothetical protein